MARRSRKPKLADLPGQPDPTSDLDSALFLAVAAPVLKSLKADLLTRAKGSEAVTQALEARHEAEKKARRTADAFVAWEGRFIEQVAAAWLLSCVFVRTLEDRGLIDQPRLAGAGAMDSQRLFFEMAPSLSERDYLRTDRHALSLRRPFRPLRGDGAGARTELRRRRKGCRLTVTRRPQRISTRQASRRQASGD